MSIDTKEKRANVLGVGRPWMRGKFPVATPDEQWRISRGNAYGGNALSAHVVVVPDSDGLMYAVPFSALPQFRAPFSRPEFAVNDENPQFRVVGAKM